MNVCRGWYLSSGWVVFGAQRELSRLPIASEIGLDWVSDVGCGGGDAGGWV